MCCVFQSTHPRRVWLILREEHLLYIRFQSTHPRRVWHVYLLRHHHLLGFNPHTHEGCDLHDLALKQLDLVSIHTPTKGVTWISLYFCNAVAVSIHTPTKGVTKDRIKQRRAALVSIHTPTKGVTLISKIGVVTILFQSTHPRRVWLSLAP